MTDARNARKGMMKSLICGGMTTMQISKETTKEMRRLSEVSKNEREARPKSWLLEVRNIIVTQ